MRNKILFIIIFSVLAVKSEHLFISVLSDKKISSVIITSSVGEYEIINDNQKISDLNPLSILNISVLNKKILLRNMADTIGIYDSLFINSLDSVNVLELKAINKTKFNRYYDDNLIITVKDGSLFFINNVDINKYVAGVVKSEGGYNKHIEYYKVQAIICRTYALREKEKHIDEKFQLCDMVHCQVYAGKSRDSLINKAVDETRNLVLVDKNNNLISAVFHSNSGGQTLNSEDVWQESRPYLKAVVDTFSYNQKNSKWEKTIPFKSWNNYIYKKYRCSINDTCFKFIQENRINYIYIDSTKISLKDVRKDWDLKSTFFSIKQINSDTLLFEGKGYGHGVGLAQEGAMNMANYGYDYKTIINFYYNNVSIIKLAN